MLNLHHWQNIFDGMPTSGCPCLSQHVTLFIRGEIKQNLTKWLSMSIFCPTCYFCSLLDPIVQWNQRYSPGGRERGLHCGPDPPCCGSTHRPGPSPGIAGGCYRPPGPHQQGGECCGVSSCLVGSSLFGHLIIVLSVSRVVRQFGLGFKNTIIGELILWLTTFKLFLK